MVVRHPQTPVYSCGEPQDVVDGIPHRPRWDPRAWERWMAQRHSPPAQQVQVAERVTFLDGDVQLSAARASAWLVAHQLAGWSFQFDNATQRAGCCNYQTLVISLAHACARAAADADIDDTLLHAIAHALVGKVPGHDPVWQ